MIFDKPFSFDEMLRRTIFKGRPNFFNAKDFNKELLIIHSFIEEFNSVFAVSSDVVFTIPSFNEVVNSGTNTIDRSMNINWSAGTILYKGVRFKITTGGVSSYTQTYSVPNTSISPKGVKPPTYICLVGELGLVTYADDPVLCGIQSDEVPASVPTVDVEQYKNINIVLTDNPASISNVLCVLAVIHPRYSTDGSDNGFGFLYYTFKNPDFKLHNGTDRQISVWKNNKTLFEYLLERVSLKLENVLNERQLVRRFNLADLENKSKSRHNIGLSKLVNHRQLVQEENLRDLTDLTLARHNLGLGNSATRNVGTSATDVAPGNLVPVGTIVMWSGQPSSIPAGWVLCDGTNNTPDLRGKFVVGLNVSIPEFNLIGKEGGTTEIQIQVQNLPDYVLPVSQQPHKHRMPHQIYIQTAGKAGNDAFHRVNGGYVEDRYTDNSTVNLEVKSGGANQKIKKLPPYYTLCYMMYKGTNITPPTSPTLPPPLVYPNFSTPDNANDNGYSSYTPNYIGGSGNVSVGSGIILTNPE